MRIVQTKWLEVRKGLIIPVLILSFPAVIGLPMNATAVFFLFLTLLPLLHTIFVTRDFRVLDPLVLVSSIYCIGYPIPVLMRSFLNDPLLSTSSDADIATALLWSYRGFTFFILSYLIVQYYFTREGKKSIDEALPKLRAFRDYVGVAQWIGVISILSMLGGFLMDGLIAPAFLTSEYADRASSTRQFLHHLTQLGYGYFFIYWTLRLRSVRRRTLDYLFYVLLFLHGLLIIGAGAKYYFLATMLSMLFALHSTKKIFASKKVLGFLLALVFVYMTFSVVTNYRVTLSDTYIDDSIDFIDKVITQAEMFREAVILSFEEYRVGKVEHSLGVSRSIFERLTAVNSLVKLIQFSDGVPPFENATQALLIPIYTIMPSSLFPEKAHFFDAGDLAYMYGWRYGGISVTLIGSLYWCWGYAGICMGMVFVGSLFALMIAQSERSTSAGVIYQALLIVMLLHLVEPGRTFQSIVLDLTRPALFLLVIYFGRRLFRIQ